MRMVLSANPADARASTNPASRSVSKSARGRNRHGCQPDVMHVTVRSRNSQKSRPPDYPNGAAAGGAEPSYPYGGNQSGLERAGGDVEPTDRARGGRTDLARVAGRRWDADVNRAL